MAMWSRLMNAITTGIRAYNENALVPDEYYGWDEYAARLFRYWHYQTYLDNTVYSQLTGYAALYRDRNKLYQSIRPVYNPVARQNNLIVSNVYQGAIDTQTITDGALPVKTDNPAVLDALRQVIRWSKLGEALSLYVKYAALYGDCGIKVIDDRASRKVRVELVHPSKIRDVERDAVGNVKSAIIEYARTDDANLDAVSPSRFGVNAVQPGLSYTYTEKITSDTRQVGGSQPGMFQTFRDGEPYAYYTDANGTPISEWQNDYGFVPLVIAHYSNSGMKWGTNSFYASVRKIDEINDAASLINDQVRKSVNPMWYFSGVAQADELKPSSTARDKIPAIYGPEGSQPHAMIMNLPIADALANLQNMLNELERDMPELSLQRIREGGSLTAPGVRSAYSDAIGNIQNARKALDPALVAALQMAISIGGYNGYDGFESFSLDSYARGDLDFDIRERPVINDSLSKQERIIALQGISAQPSEIQRLMLRELDYPERDIDAVIAETETIAQQAQGVNFGAADGAAVTDTLQRLGLDQSLTTQSLGG